jgi:Xaa-Pro aminopeptidase
MKTNEVPIEELVKRRSRLGEVLPENSLFIVFSNEVFERNSGVNFEFRQESNFWYLTGINEDFSAYLIFKNSSGFLEEILFVKQPNNLENLWDGSRLGFNNALEISGLESLEQIKDFAEITKEVQKYKGRIKNLYLNLDQKSSYKNIRNEILNIVSNFGGLENYIKPETLTKKLRLYKSNWEIRQIKRASKITIDAHLNAVQVMKEAIPKTTGFYEYEFEAVLDYFYRRNSAGSAYKSIVAGGNNANTLHYAANSQKLRPGDLLLVDAGAEFNYYASDITRAYPINGKFKRPQRIIYEIVLKAQNVAISESASANATFKSIHDVAVNQIISDLQDLGFLKESLDEILEKKLYKKFFMHGIGHWMGLDVHDVGDSIDFLTGERIETPLEPGMVFTIEPGIYLPSESEDTPLEFRGIGVRIEDNILITKDGIENLSRKMPKNPDEVEGLFM